MQKDLLETIPDADVRVYAVWFAMVPGDARSEWPPDLLTDARVEHLWDEEKTIGTWYARHAASMRERLTPESKWNDGTVLWDAYLLYSSDAKWEGDGPPTALIHWGRTVVAARQSLRADFDSR